MTSLNPVYTIGEQIAEPIRIHLGKSRREAAAEAVRLLTRSAFPIRRGARSNIRTNSRAACASAPPSPWRSPATRRC